MAGYKTFDLLFLWDKEDPMVKFDAIAHVTVGQRSDGGYKGHEDAILLTRQCASLTEFEHQVERLRKELDDVARKARQKFAELAEFRKTQAANDKQT